MINSEAVTIDNIKYISDEYIPTSTNNIGNFLDICKKIKDIDKLPIKDLNVQFSSDIWDLSPLITDKYQSTLTDNFIFSNIPVCFKDTIKFFIYYQVTRNKRKKLQTLHGDLIELRPFLRFLSDEYISSFDNIDSKIIFKYLNKNKDENKALSTIVGYASVIKNFLIIYDANLSNNNKDFSIIIKNLKSYISKNGVRIKNDKSRKTPNIPQKYFNELLSILIEIMDSENEDIDKRATACCIVIMSQTGLRLSQVLSLEANSVTPLSILDNTKTAYFLEFVEIKRKNGNNLYTREKTILNDLGHKAYKILLELYKERRKDTKSDYLYIPHGIRRFPCSDDTFNSRAKDIYFEYADKLGTLNTFEKYPELSYVRMGDYRESKRGTSYLADKYNDNDIISYPVAHQYRVHLCTELYLKNVPLQIIRHYMNHLSDDMPMYYVRTPEYTEKEDSYANAVLTTIVKDDIKPLGTGTDSLITKIDDFIKKGNFNISKDIDTVISELKRRIPIKEKFGGICIKSGPRRDCSKDAQTDEFYCAYNVCPNHFHLYSMADITYNRCKMMVRTVKHNKDNGFIRQSQKEQNKLNHVVKHSFLPELNQLKEVIDKKGLDWVKENNPNLEYIIDNYNDIVKEANEWIA